jgi:hypothetical protein
MWLATVLCPRHHLDEGPKNVYVTSDEGKCPAVLRIPSGYWITNCVHTLVSSFVLDNTQHQGSALHQLFKTESTDHNESAASITRHRLRTSTFVLVEKDETYRPCFKSASYIASVREHHDMRTSRCREGARPLSRKVAQIHSL